MKITIHQLPEGVHKIKETVKAGDLHFYEDEHFFSDIKLNIVLNKFGSNIKVRVNLETQAKYECNKCLSEFIQPYEDEFEMVYYLGEKKLEIDEDDVVILSPEEKEIDLSNRIIESLALGIPIKKICIEDCKGICAHCGADLNHEKCKCPDKPVDPRWDNLRKLLK
ncbi:MAG: DUF177 domain-containing protein [Calditrichia bacterium]|nr:DUF177 domain-containing protein [Calditrichia bacterium]